MEFEIYYVEKVFKSTGEEVSKRIPVGTMLELADGEGFVIEPSRQLMPKGIYYAERKGE